MQTKTTRKHILDLIFLVGLLWKGIDGFFEFLGGIALFFLSPTGVASLVHNLTAEELLEDPHDFIANLLIHGTSNLGKNFLLFGAVYLVIHGAVKLAIFGALVVGAVKVYPWAIGALSILTVYQIVELVIHPGVGLALLTALDIIIIALTVREWREKHTVRETLEGTWRWITSQRQ
ncbi:MAG TPA: DUF2127 domain-containing protein [Dongiaceae bacterium]|nr:DUF2127 domain-containing protein [Dongiaceae bacterium]